MSTAVWPPLSPGALKKAEDDSTARELSWFLDSLQETLASLKSLLEKCYALLAPIEPGSTLVMSSPRSESIKKHITRVGTRIVKGTLALRLRIHPALNLTLSPAHPLLLPPLTTLRTLLNQSLDLIDITRWTGDRHSAPSSAPNSTSYAPSSTKPSQSSNAPTSSHPSPTLAPTPPQQQSTPPKPNPGT